MRTNMIPNKHSTNHALIQITEEIREAIDNNKFACGFLSTYKRLLIP